MILPTLLLLGWMNFATAATDSFEQLYVANCMQTHGDRESCVFAATVLQEIYRQKVIPADFVVSGQVMAPGLVVFHLLNVHRMCAESETHNGFCSVAVHSYIIDVNSYFNRHKIDYQRRKAEGYAPVVIADFHRYF